MKKILAALFALALLITGTAGCSKSITAPPENVSATADSSGAVRISWDAHAEAVYYRLYRKNVQMQDYKYICDLTSPEYTDNNVQPGVSYRYKIEIIFAGGVSDGAETNEITVPEPQTVTADQSPTDAVITSVTRMDKYTVVLQIENNVPGSEYEILRSDSQDGEYNAVGRTDSSLFYDTDNMGDYNYYEIRAVTDSAESDVSSPVQVGTNAKSVFGVPVFMYHEFVTQQDLDSGVAFDKYAVWSSEFESDLIWLRDNGYTTITTAQLVDYLNFEGSLPDKPIILSIDDGKLGVYKNAYPLLKKYNMTATLALIGTEIDHATQNPESRQSDPAPYCTWEEIREMSDSGAVEMISHTYGLHVFDHDGKCGANCAEGESIESFLPIAQTDFVKIRNKVLDETGKDIVAMAYPYSRRSATADRAWVKSGYQLLLCGNDSNDYKRRSYINYFVREAGINPNSALIRRLVRMTGTPIQDYLTEAIEHDSY